MRVEMGDRLRVMQAYQIDRAKQPSINAANRTLLRQVGTKVITDEELRKIKVPVALIWGRHDRINPLKHAERASATFGWPLYPIEDAAHIPMAENPAAFGRALREVLEG